MDQAFVNEYIIKNKGIDCGKLYWYLGRVSLGIMLLFEIS